MSTTTNIMDNKVLIWASGGLAAGCILGVCTSKIIKMLFNGTATSQSSHYGLEIVNGMGKFNEQVTTYSNITMLLGSPTVSSGLLETQEYHLYTAAAGYPELSGNRSILARHLTQELYEELYGLKTPSGFDLDSCIQTGIDNPDKVSCGIVAGDEECYELFSGLFDLVITDRHRGFVRGAKNIGKITIADLQAVPFDSRYVKSTHFLVGRCLRGFRFPPSCRRAEREHLESVLKEMLESLEDQFNGTYIRLPDLTAEQRYQLPDILQSVADCPTSRTLVSSGSTRDWPSGRGLYHSNDLNFFAWTNREDHLRMMYRDRNLDFIKSFKEFSAGMKQIENKISQSGLEFAVHDDYGYLLTCPSGIGTALRAGVHMKLPNLLRDQRFRTILKNLRLHMGAEDQEMLRKGYVDVYNMDRLGYEQCHLVQHVADSVHLLVDMERRLERNDSISDLIHIKDDEC